jgi:membrane protease YdiL (CAAX protease family)
MAQIIIAGSMFIPMIGALITKTIFKKENIKLPIKPKIKKNTKYYLMAWFLPTVIAIVGAALYFLVFRNFDISAPFFRQQLEGPINAGQITESMIPQILLALVLSGIVIAPFINMIFVLGEEIGWRGFLLPSLLEKYSVGKSILISGVIWGLWHAPITMMGHNYGFGYWGYPITGIIAMCVFCISFGSFLSYLTIKTGSIWPATLAHGAVNAIAGIGIYFSTPDKALLLLLGPTTAGLIAVIPCVILGALCYIKVKDTRWSESEV